MTSVYIYLLVYAMASAVATAVSMYYENGYLTIGGVLACLLMGWIIMPVGCFVWACNASVLDKVILRKGK